MDDSRRHAIKKAIKAFTAKATASPKIARDTLVKEGIYLKTGELAPEYRPRSTRKAG
jgi:hypothetical protein